MLAVQQSPPPPPPASGSSLPCVSYTETLLSRGYTDIHVVNNSPNSIVLKATLSSSEAVHCIKLVSPSSSAFNIIDTQQEALFLQRACSNDFARYIDSFTDQCYLYLITEYMQHGDFLMYVNKFYPYPKHIPDFELKYIGYKIAVALYNLHVCHNRAHGDLSLENIGIASDGRVCLLDVGGSLSLTPSGTYRARLRYQFKASYVSPERVSHDKGATWFAVADDLHAFGVCLLMAVCGFDIFRRTDPSNDRWYRVFWDGSWRTSMHPEAVTLRSWMSEDLQMLIDGLIKPQSKRWGWTQVRECKWFAKYQSPSSK